jgi:hypothetical protein
MKKIKSRINLSNWPFNVHHDPCGMAISEFAGRQSNEF